MSQVRGWGWGGNVGGVVVVVGAGGGGVGAGGLVICWRLEVGRWGWRGDGVCRRVVWRFDEWVGVGLRYVR